MLPHRRRPLVDRLELVDLAGEVLGLEANRTRWLRTRAVYWASRSRGLELQRRGRTDGPPRLRVLRSPGHRPRSVA